MRHLDDLLFQQLSAAPAAVPAEVWAHLRSDCPTCADYLAARRGADGVDGRVDAALLGSPAAPAPAGELERILARAHPPRRWARPLLAAAAVAFALLGGALALRGRPADPDEGVKGEGLPLGIRTTFAVVGPDRRVEAGVSGASYRPDEVLSLQLLLNRRAKVSLVRRDAAGVEVLLLNQPTPAGRSYLKRSEELVGVPLTGLVGEQELRVVASERDLSEAEVRAAAAGAEVQDARTDGFSVRVAP